MEGDPVQMKNSGSEPLDTATETRGEVLQKCTEHLLCASHCSKCYIKVPVLTGAYIPVGEGRKLTCKCYIQIMMRTMNKITIGH